MLHDFLLFTIWIIVFSRYYQIIIIQNSLMVDSIEYLIVYLKIQIRDPKLKFLVLVPNPSLPTPFLLPVPRPLVINVIQSLILLSLLHQTNQLTRVYPGIHLVRIFLYYLRSLSEILYFWATKLSRMSLQTNTTIHFEIVRLDIHEKLITYLFKLLIFLRIFRNQT